MLLLQSLDNEHGRNYALASFYKGVASSANQNLKSAARNKDTAVCALCKKMKNAAWEHAEKLKPNQPTVSDEKQDEKVDSDQKELSPTNTPLGADQQYADFQDFYYTRRFGHPYDQDKVDAIVLKYLTTLQFVLHYYHEECPDWTYHYDHHYGPLLSDVVAFIGRN